MYQPHHRASVILSVGLNGMISLNMTNEQETGNQVLCFLMSHFLYRLLFVQPYILVPDIDHRLKIV